MFEGYTPKQIERAIAVCEAFGITLEELEQFDRADGYSAARREADQREAAFHQGLVERLPKVAAEVTADARAEGWLPEGHRFESVADV